MSSTKMCRGIFFAVVALTLLVSGEAFLTTPVAFSSKSTALRSSAVKSTDTAEISKMRASEIQKELKDMGVPYSDCFEKESLVQRLADSRRNPPPPKQEAPRTSSTAKTRSRAQDDDDDDFQGEVKELKTTKMPRDDDMGGFGRRSGMDGGVSGIDIGSILEGMMGVQPGPGGVYGDPFGGGGGGRSRPGYDPDGGIKGGRRGSAGPRGVNGVKPDFERIFAKANQDPELVKLISKATSNTEWMDAITDVLSNGPGALYKYRNADPELVKLIEGLLNLL